MGKTIKIQSWKNSSNKGGSSTLSKNKPTTVKVGKGGGCSSCG